MTTASLLLQALFVPVVGILGNEFNRVYIIAVGNLFWGGMSVGFGFSRNLTEVLPFISCAALPQCCNSASGHPM